MLTENQKEIVLRIRSNEELKENTAYRPHQLLPYEPMPGPLTYRKITKHEKHVNTLRRVLKSLESKGLIRTESRYVFNYVYVDYYLLPEIWEVEL